jgi:hypothetical protein
MGGQAPPDAATRARSGRPAGGRRSRGCPDAADVRCPRVRCPRVRRHPGVRTDGPAVFAALPPRCPHRAGPWNGSVPRAVPVGRMGSTCRRGLRAAWSTARIGPDGKGWCWVGRGWLARGSTPDLGRPIAGAQARRRLAAWPTREPVQRHGAGRLAGGPENTQVLTSPPAGASWAGAGVVPDHGAGQGGGDHAPWSSGW